MVISTINLQYRKLPSDQSIDAGFTRKLFQANSEGKLWRELEIIYLNYNA